MQFITDEELSDLVAKKHLEIYKICINYSGNHEKARQAGDLIRMDIDVNVWDDKYIHAVALIKPPKYGSFAGEIETPDILKGYIVDKMPNTGWVLAEISDEMWW
ncbi:MAG: hypothetical protein NDI94_05435 [Candidatus Woesearchaeota archaeon]|nr:hypothetical protein [Candidatus Woesearchaeota archaeon]